MCESMKQKTCTICSFNDDVMQTKIFRAGSDSIFQPAFVSVDGSKSNKENNKETVLCPGESYNITNTIKQEDSILSETNPHNSVTKFKKKNVLNVNTQ